MTLNPVRGQTMTDRLVYGSHRPWCPDGYYNSYSFDFITPRLATGGFILSDTDANLVRSKGITHIIACGLIYQPEHFPADFPYIHCSTRDDAQDKGIDWFQPGITFALQALSQPNNKVYAHCHHGQNRGPSMAYAILRALGWNKGHAHTLIAKARPMAKNMLYRKDADRAITTLGYD